MLKTCIIIPCYNESKRLDVESFIDFYGKHQDIHLCFVNDGSTDETLNIIRSMCNGRSDRMSFINQSTNTGKSEAIRKGILVAFRQQTYDCLGYIDADLSTPLSELARLVRYFALNTECQMLMGSRILYLGANIKRKALRHYCGRIFATVASRTIKMGVYDTQCGMKLFRTELAKRIFHEPFLSKWLFDVELIFRVINLMGHLKTSECLREIPLNQWIDKGYSKVSLMNYLTAPFILIKIALHYKRTNIN